VDLFYALLAFITAGLAYFRFRIAKRVRARADTARSRHLWLRLVISAIARIVAACLFAIAAITSSRAVFVAGLFLLLASVLVSVVFSFARPKR
jgi:ABC-type uncharacterized transport system permease subunit